MQVWDTVNACTLPVLKGLGLPTGMHVSYIIYNIRAASWPPRTIVLECFHTFKHSQVWDTVNGCTLSVLEGSELSTGMYMFSGTGRVVASALLPGPPASLMDGPEEVAVWDAESGEMLGFAAGRDPLLSPDGKLLSLKVGCGV